MSGLGRQVAPPHHRRLCQWPRRPRSSRPDPTPPSPVHKGAAAASIEQHWPEAVFGRASPGLPLLESLGNQHQVEPSQRARKNEGEQRKLSIHQVSLKLGPHCGRGSTFPARTPSLSVQHRCRSHLVKTFWFYSLIIFWCNVAVIFGSWCWTLFV